MHVARFLLILALVMHPLAVVGGLDPCAAGQVAEQRAQSCCCGPESCCPTQQMPACGCSVESAPRPTEEQPATPRVLDGQVILLALVLTDIQWDAGPVERPMHPALLAPPHSSNSHRQAVLCIWRT